MVFSPVAFRDTCSQTEKEPKMKDLVRTLLGIRKKRRALPLSAPPTEGAVIVRNDIKAIVTQPLNEELWDWMMLSGWRLNPVKNDRRHYRSLPHGAVDQLIACDKERRSSLHRNLLQSVQPRR
jgi:hypothetical protein